MNDPMIPEKKTRPERFLEDLFKGEGFFKRRRNAHSWYGWLARIVFGLWAVVVLGGIAALALIGGSLYLYDAALNVRRGRWAQVEWFGVLLAFGFILVVLVCIAVLVGYHVEQFLTQRRRGSASGAGRR